jgi:hypothetical protein
MIQLPARGHLGVLSSVPNDGRWILGNADLATDFGVGANSQVAVHATLAQRFVVVRYERYAENFLALLHLACCLILLRGL